MCQAKKGLRLLKMQRLIMEEDKICHPEKKINKDLLKVKKRENEKNMRVQEIIATREIIGYTLLSHFFKAFI